MLIWNAKHCQEPLFFMASTRSNFLRYHSLRSFAEWDHLCACAVPRKVHFLSLYTDIQATKMVVDRMQSRWVCFLVYCYLLFPLFFSPFYQSPQRGFCPEKQRLKTKLAIWQPLYKRRKLRKMVDTWENNSRFSETGYTR